MKKKLFTLLTLLLCVCSGAWADETQTIQAGTNSTGPFTYSALTAYIYDNNYWAKKTDSEVISITKGSSFSFTNTGGVTITAITVKGCAQNNETKNSTITITDDAATPHSVTAARTGDNKWSGRQTTTPTSVTISSGISDLKMTAGTVYTVSNGNTSGDYALGIQIDITYTTSGGGGKTALTGAWDPTSVSVAKDADAPSNPTFAVSGGATKDTHYTVTYSEVSDANNIVTTNASTGITAISTSTAGTATIRATVALTSAGEESYSLATTTYDITISVEELLSGYPDANYLELNGGTSSGSITFSKKNSDGDDANYVLQSNGACTFYGNAFAKALKHEGKTRTTFTTAETSTITIVQSLGTNTSATIEMNVDGGSYKELSTWDNVSVTTYADESNLNYKKVKIFKITDCKAGTYIIKINSGQPYMAYVGVTYTPKTGTTVDTGTHDPYYANNSNATGYSSGGKADELTFNGIATLTGTNMQSGSTLLTVDGNTYTSIKAARGSTHELTPAEGVTITGVTLYATSNSAEDAAIITTGAGDTNITTRNNNTTPTSVALTKNGEGKYYFTVSNSSANFQALVVLKITYTTPENIDVAVSSAGYATLYYDKKLAVPTGVTAYKAAVKDGSTITITPLDGNVIPANTGVILKADQGTYNFVVTDDEAADVTGNILEGSTTATTKTALGGTVYTLGQNSSGVVGLRNYTGETIRPYSAYATTVSASRAFYPFSDDETTGINAVNTEAKEINDGVYYNLNGQRVTTPRKGLYIVNGKKVMVK